MFFLKNIAALEITSHEARELLKGLDQPRNVYRYVQSRNIRITKVAYRQINGDLNLTGHRLSFNPQDEQVLPLEELPLEEKKAMDCLNAAAAAAIAAGYRNLAKAIYTELRNILPDHPLANEFLGEYKNEDSGEKVPNKQEFVLKQLELVLKNLEKLGGFDYLVESCCRIIRKLDPENSVVKKYDQEIVMLKQGESPN